MERQTKNVEQNLQNKFINLLNRRDVPYYKTQGGLLFSRGFKKSKQGEVLQGFPVRQQSGWPDLIFFENGSTTFVEFKTDDGKLRDSQKELIATLLKQNQDVVILRPRDWDNVKRHYQNLKDNSSYPMTTAVQISGHLLELGDLE